MFFSRVLFAFLLLVGCSKNNQYIPSHVDTKDTEQVDSVLSELRLDQSIMVVNQDGSGVADAEIYIDQNSFVTDADGILKIPSTWKKEAAITIRKTGYINTVYLKQKPEAHIYIINQQKSEDRFEVEGAVNGFDQLKTDGFIDFGLIIPSLDVANSLNLDIAKMISPEMDTINVMGKSLQIPSNVFLPKQKENYGFIPITLEKAFYSLFFDFAGDYRIQASRGKFDFKKVSDKLQNGGNFFEAISDFQFLSVGTHNVQLNQPKVVMNLESAKMPLLPKADFTMPAPQGPDNMLFGIGMFEDAGRLFTSDIKLRDNKVQKFSLPQNTKNFALLALTSKEKVSDKVTKLSYSMSTTLVPVEDLAKAYVLERVPAPQSTGNGIKMQEPILKGNLRDYATYVTLSKISTLTTKRYAIERKDVLWEIYSPGWISTVELPAHLLDQRDSQRWDVVFFGIDSEENKQFNGPTSLNQATHAVHNAVDF